MRLPSYSKYEPSNVEWLGDVPEHWETGKFSREVRIAEGQVDPEIEPYSSMLLVAPNHIESGTGRLLAKETAANQGAISGKYLCSAGEVIYSKIRPALAKAVLAPEDCLCSADMYPMRSTGRLRSRYLLLVLLSSQFTAWSVLEADRVAMPKVNRETLNDLRLPIPPLNEQDAIADFLERETAKIDSLVAKKRTLIERLKEKRTALISGTVTRGLPPDAACAAGLDPYPKLKPSGIDWLGDVPAHWEVKRLKFILATSLKYGANEAAELDDPGLPRYVRITDIDENGGLRDETFKSLPVEVAAEYLLREGDLLFARSGATAGKTFLYRSTWGTCAYAGYLIRARLDLTKGVPEFVRYFTSSDNYWQWLSSAFIQATIQNVSAERYASLWLPVPAPAEQKAMADFLDRETAKIGGMVAKVETAVERLQEYRAALITAVVTGKKDVRGAFA